MECHTGPEQRQLMMMRLGACHVALMLASCADDDVCQAGVELGVALLRGGNREVQKKARA